MHRPSQPSSPSSASCWLTAFFGGQHLGLTDSGSPAVWPERDLPPSIVTRKLPPQETKHIAYGSLLYQSFLYLRSTSFKNMVKVHFEIERHPAPGCPEKASHRAQVFGGVPTAQALLTEDELRSQKMPRVISLTVLITITISCFSYG